MIIIDSARYCGYDRAKQEFIVKTDLSNGAHKKLGVKAQAVNPYFVAEEAVQELADILEGRDAEFLPDTFDVRGKSLVLDFAV